MVNRLQRWLSVYPTKRDAVLLVASVAVFDLLWSTLVVVSIVLINPVLIEQSPDHLGALSFLTFPSIGISVLLEELVFRILPLTFALRRWKIGWQTLTILTISSILFGLAHGDLTHTASNIGHVFAQGVSGFLYGSLLIKLSRLGSNMKQAGWTVIALHCAVDFVLVGIIFAFST